MTTDPFASPPEPTSSGVKTGDFLGRLLLIRPLLHERDYPTRHGPTDAIRCRIAVLDGPTPGMVHEEAILFGRQVVGQLRQALDTGVEMVLGRMGQGEAKQGQSPPWRLMEPTEADRQTARGYLASGSATAPPTAPPSQPTAYQPPPPSAPRPFQAPSPSAEDEFPF
jgi:hypothetical protein